MRASATSLFVAATLACATAAYGQGAPVSLLPAPPPPAPVPSTVPKPVSADGISVQATPLGALDPNGLGPLTTADGALPGNGWTDTPAALITRLLPELPPASAPELRALERRLLLSPLQPPADASPGSLIEARARALYAMGDLEGVSALLQALPPGALTPGLARLATDSALLRGDDDGACASLKTITLLDAKDAFPTELGIYCQFVAGRGQDAELGLDALRDEKVDDPGFFALADVLSGVSTSIPLDAMANPSPLTLAMAARAKATLPAATANANQPAVLRAVALSPGAAPAVRQAAAERAYVAGAIGPDVLGQIYASQARPDGRALLYQTATSATPAARADAIIKATAEKGAGLAELRLYGATVAGMQPSPELASFAPTAIRVLLAANQADAAKAWLPLLAQPDADRLGPLLRIAALSETGGLAAWRKTSDTPAAALQRRGDVALSLYAALGIPIPAGDLATLLDGPVRTTAAVPRAAISAELSAAAQGNRVPETVLLTLVTLAPGDLAAADPTELSRAVAALNAVGLGPDAHRLAIEAALANGL